MKEQPKVYRHPVLGWTAEDSNSENAHYGEHSYTVKVPGGDSVLGYWFSLEELLSLGFEEVQEEKKEVPEWFKTFLDSGDEDTTDEEMYELFLKHYPKQDALPVDCYGDAIVSGKTGVYGPTVTLTTSGF